MGGWGWEEKKKGREGLREGGRRKEGMEVWRAGRVDESEGGKTEGREEGRGMKGVKGGRKRGRVEDSYSKMTVFYSVFLSSHPATRRAGGCRLSVH